MQQWEYGIEHVSPNVTEAQLQKWFAEAGKSGWEFVCAVEHPGRGGLLYHFKRPLGGAGQQKPFTRIE